MLQQIIILLMLLQKCSGDLLIHVIKNANNNFISKKSLLKINKLVLNKQASRLSSLCLLSITYNILYTGSY